MIKKILTWGLCLVFVDFSVCPAYADQSLGYQTYFYQGVKAFGDYDQQKPLRFFKIAQIYDPANEELKRYLSIFDQKGVVFKLPPSLVPPAESIGYKYYFSGGIEAFQKHNDEKAVRYFKIALIFNPASRESERYLRILYQRQGLSYPVVTVPQAIAQLQPSSSSSQPQPVAAIAQSYTPSAQPQPVAAITQAQPYTPSAQPQPVAAIAQSYTPSAQPQPVAAITQAQPYTPSAQPQPAAVINRPAVYVSMQKAKNAPAIILLAQATNNGQIKPKLQIELNSSVILEGKNIQRFLVVDEGYITGKTIDTDHLRFDALRIGTTFLHVWDNFGRYTFYVEVVFPKYTSPYGPQAVNNGVQHSQPFKVIYTNDWDTYYSGKNIPGLKRQSYEFTESLAVTGETPYGFFDASGSYIDFNAFSEFDTYTIGLSQIPIDGTSNFNLRGFDALRYLSPLTLPGTRLRGAFADVDMMGDTLGLSVSHGQEQVPLGFFTVAGTQFNKAYIDAVKLTLFPKSDSDRYSFNYATGYGQDRPGYLSNHVYSVEGLHKLNDFLTFTAEQGSDSSHQATLASLKWKDGDFRTGLHFRDIDKNYSTISTLPAYQGEIGTSWTTDGDFKNFTESTFVEAYQDRLNPNPDHPNALNFDASGQLRANLTQNSWSDSNFNYVDTAGEPSPTRSLGLNERISRSFGIWKAMKGTVFTGAGYQNSHSTGSNISDYDREDVVAGIQLPLTNHISSYVNYEYDWLNQPSPSGSSNPSVINAGLEYQKDLTPKLSFNSQLDYHDELGVKTGDNSFLSGEKSVIISGGFNYNPAPDVNFFADGNASKVFSHTGSPSYDDFEVHLGVRITFGGATYWDPLGTVSGIVFKDRNGSGKFVSGDDGIQGVKVKVGDKVAVTDKNGRYRIKVRAAGVDVAPELDSIPGGLLFSTPQSLNVRIFQGREARADFGLIVQTGIYGLVFVDKKGTGSPNSGDKFIGKVKVIMDGKTIQKSDSNGAFYFRNVSPGQHIISIDINTLPLNMVPLVKLKNKIDVPEGSNYMFNIPIQIKQAQGDQN